MVSMVAAHEAARRSLKRPGHRGCKKALLAAHIPALKLLGQRE